MPAYLLASSREMPRKGKIPFLIEAKDEISNRCD